LDWIVFRNLKRDLDQGLGKSGQPRAKYFVDLREACLVGSQRQTLVDLMADYVRSRIIVAHFDGVVGCKAGNPLLAAGVAEALGLPLMLVREWPIYGNYIETVLSPSRRLFLIDDVWADGSVLIEAIQRVRDAGFTLAHVFLFIRRTEGNIEEELKAAYIAEFGAIHTMSDQDLEDLAARVRQT
jgi:orotate phosphoribosyltransferase